MEIISKLYGTDYIGDFENFLIENRYFNLYITLSLTGNLSQTNAIGIRPRCSNLLFSIS